MKRFNVLLLCTAGALTSFSTFAAFLQPGKITAGSDMTFYPYEYMQNNQPAGFDIEFLAGLAKTIGREAVNTDTRFPNLIPRSAGRAVRHYQLLDVYHRRTPEGDRHGAVPEKRRIDPGA